MTVTAWLAGHTDEATAYVVADYPYGFTAGTQIRYWVETTKHGDRMCAQTMNPKTERWNKPKKTTYLQVGALFLNEDGHVKWTGVDYNGKQEWLDKFVAAVELDLTDLQLERIAKIRGYEAAMRKVKWEVVETTNWTAEQRAERDAEQAKENQALNLMIAVHTAQERVAMALPAQKMVG